MEKASSLSTAPPTVFLLTLFFFLLRGAAAASSPTSCSTSVVFHGKHLHFSTCTALPTQGASLAWTLTPRAPGSSSSSSAHDQLLQVLFQGTAPSASGWAGWGINPDALAMEGTQAFLAFQASNGSTVLPFNVARGAKQNGIKSGAVSLDVVSMAAEVVGSAISSLVTLRVDTEQVKKANVVWSRGAKVNNFVPGVHGFTQEDLTAMTNIDFTSEASTRRINPGGAVRLPHYKLKIVHALLNAVGWGFVLPIGVLVARYLKPLVPGSPAWFYLHIAVQLSGFALGTAGWATGLALGSLSPGVVFQSHRCVGIAAFALCLLQLLCAFLLRPKPHHRLRCAWNYFHYTFGLATIALALANIFLGFDILQPDRIWRVSFVGVLAAILGLAFLFELVRCCFLLRRRIQLAESQSQTVMVQDEKSAVAV